jgi:hypothetical protein
LCSAEESKGEGEGDAQLLTALDPQAVLSDIHALAQSVETALAHCQSSDVELPPPLELEGAQSEDPDDPALTQFRDLLAWDVSCGEPDPGEVCRLALLVSSLRLIEFDIHPDK